MDKVKETRATYAAEPSFSPSVSWRFPRALAWLQEFDAEEQNDFFQELLTSIAGAMTTGHWSQVADLVDAWRETAFERTDPELQTRLTIARQELAKGQAQPWEKVKQELGL